MKNKLFFSRIILLFLALRLVQGLTAQGIISGMITDESTGEPLIGANVIIEGTTTGNSTDFDGKYQFKAPAGTHNIVISYTGYQTKTVTSVEVKDGEVTYLDATLSDVIQELDIDVVVEAKAIERTENALLLLQRKSDKIQDGISSQEMSRYGVGDAASAMKKVTGATVEEGKYIVVRGLGDRYSTAQLNGVVLPSTDPYRNSAQLDLIPSNLLDNIVTTKSFTPDQPGTFTGGNVNLQTKSFPEQFTLKVDFSASYNTQSSFIDNFLSQQGGATDWLGYDDGFRKIPGILQDPEVQEFISRNGAILARGDDAVAAVVDEAIRSVNTQMAPSVEGIPLNHGISVGLGNQYRLFGNPLGVMFTVNFKKNYTHYGDGIAANWFFNGNPNAESLSLNYRLNEIKSVETPRVGGIAGLSYKFSPTNSVSFNFLYNHLTDILSLFQEGEHRDFEIFLPEVFQSRTLQFREKELINYQVMGEHVLPGLHNMKIEWTASLANSIQDEPDLRFFANEFDAERGSYAIRQSNYNLPTHFWRDLTDEQYQGKFDITLPIPQSTGTGNELKFGGLFFDKQRDFNEVRYSVNFTPSVSELYMGDPEAFFGPKNSGLVGETETGRNRIANFLDSDTRAGNSYTGSEQVWAGYLMGTFRFGQNWKFVGGARVENTDIEVASKEENSEIGRVNQLDVLPSASLIYSLTPEMNLRAAYSNTIARPNMRELAPFASFEFIGDAIFLGNPELNRTKILNTDLRWEWFPQAGELFAVSGYYKKFDDPIVQAFTQAANPEYRFVNVNEANVFGVELEFRKELDFLGAFFQNFKLGANMSIIRSAADIPQEELEIIRAYDPDADDKRPFQGQSDFIFNAALNYLTPDGDIDAVVSFNYFGDRLQTVGEEGTPDIFERGRYMLDVSVSKKLSESISLKLAGANLLNARFETSSSFIGNEFIYRQYRLGRTLSVTVSYTIR